MAEALLFKGNPGKATPEEVSGPTAKFTLRWKNQLNIECSL